MRTELEYHYQSQCKKIHLFKLGLELLSKKIIFSRKEDIKMKLVAIFSFFFA
jgi:hypothetical protein